MPDLKRNLISSGMLDSIGYSFKVESGVLKVAEGSMVVMKGIRKNGLYVLKGTVINGDADSIIDKNADKMIAWHFKGEKRVVELDTSGFASVS